MSIELVLHEIMTEFGCHYAVVLLKRGAETKEFGNIDILKHSEVIKQYFLARPQVTFEFIKGKTMPQIVSQGSVSVVICNPAEDVLVGLAVNREEEPGSEKTNRALALYRWAGAIDHRLKEKINSV